MTKSIIAGVVVAAVGLLSMGVLGGALAYLAWPVVYPLAGNPDDWRGDDVWPALIASGMLWGATFPLAGFVTGRLERRGLAGLGRCVAYVLILWCGAAVIWVFMISTLALAAPAAAATCDRQDLSGLRICSDREAVEVTGHAGWMSCGGRCVITGDATGVTVMNRKSRRSARFAGATFLPGAGSTRDLQRLPLLAADGRLLLIDPDGFEPAARISLTGFAGDNPALMPRFVEEARISTDARRFFIPSPDGPGFLPYELVGDGLKPILPAHSAMVISPSGRYGLSVDPDGDGTYAFRDYASGKTWPTEARFEIDVPFFDVDEQFLLRRHRHMAGTRISVYRIADGERLGTFARPETDGLIVRVETGRNGLTLTEIQPPG